eukprot:m.177594 g.177594  ORF g.177594 m.177594 type:complete len:79 (+) comp16574_c0_seq4:1034-1270(+)
MSLKLSFDDMHVNDATNTKAPQMPLSYTTIYPTRVGFSFGFFFMLAYCLIVFCKIIIHLACRLHVAFCYLPPIDWSVG